MRVFMRYGRDEIDLGEMPVLLLTEDRVRIVGSDADAPKFLTVGRRIFEQREMPAWVHRSVEDMTAIGWGSALVWVCILVSLETP